MTDPNPDRLAGKTIVITGAAGGFGRLVALKAGARGAKLTLGDIDKAAVDAVAAEVVAAGGKAQAVRCDVTRLADMKALVSASVAAVKHVPVYQLERVVIIAKRSDANTH